MVSITSQKTAIQVDQTRLHPDHKTPLPYAGHADTLYIDDCIYFGYGGHSARKLQMTSLQNRKACR